MWISFIGIGNVNIHLCYQICARSLKITDKCVKLTTARVFFCYSHYRLEKFDTFSTPKHGYDNVNGDLDSPASFDEIERPPLRHIDKYVRAELCGLSARYTVAFMAMMGFIISFGMKCNLSAAKSEREKTYNQTVHSHPVS